ncbi:MAG: hypothetical protein E6I38_06860 [Chloroflexi bacterium]|nr:MAG: hypothetical protein E6I38_06860 [Chloroflexota bacterium]
MLPFPHLRLDILDAYSSKVALREGIILVLVDWLAAQRRIFGEADLYHRGIRIDLFKFLHAIR